MTSDSSPKPTAHDSRRPPQTLRRTRRYAVRAAATRWRADDDRFAELWAVAHDDLSLARLAEAHADALAILHEDGRTPLPGARYAVWASEAPGCRLAAELDADGWRLSGTKRFCSGLGHVTHALVTADTPGGSALFEIPVQNAGPEARVDTSGWSTEAFAATLTGTLHLDRLHLPSTAAVGGPGWYLVRPGFWHGAIGVAACWAGGAAALVQRPRPTRVRDAHRAAHAGAMRADVWEMRAALERAAADIDRDPLDEARAGIALGPWRCASSSSGRRAMSFAVSGHPPGPRHEPSTQTSPGGAPSSSCTCCSPTPSATWKRSAETPTAPSPHRLYEEPDDLDPLAGDVTTCVHAC